MGLIKIVTDSLFVAAIFGGLLSLAFFGVAISFYLLIFSFTL